MGVLVVYPEGGELKEVPVEVRELSNNLSGVQAVGINGQGESALFDAIDRIQSRGDRVNGLWLIGHGEGYTLTIGSVTLDPWAVIMYVKALGADWVVFNSCDGDQFARMVRVATGVATASFPDGIEDTDARRFASALARGLAKNGNDLGKAVEEVSPRGSGFVVFHPAISLEASGAMQTTSTNPGTLASVGKKMNDKETQDFVELIHGLELRLTVLETQTRMRLEQVLTEIQEIKTAKSPGISKSTWGIVLFFGIIALAYFLGLALIIGRSV